MPLYFDQFALATLRHTSHVVPLSTGLLQLPETHPYLSGSGHGLGAHPNLGDSIIVPISHAKPVLPLGSKPSLHATLHEVPFVRIPDSGQSPLTALLGNGGMTHDV
jgi:hypothetical protein